MVQTQPVGEELAGDKEINSCLTLDSRVLSPAISSLAAGTPSGSSPSALNRQDAVSEFFVVLTVMCERRKLLNLLLIILLTPGRFVPAA